MPIRVSTIVTTPGVATQIYNYCYASNPIVAIGGGVTWGYPDVPPPPNLLLATLPSQIGYVQAIRLVPIVKDINGDIAVSMDEAWQTLPVTPEAILAANCHHVMIEAKIDHQQLPGSATTYQSAGVYLNCNSSASLNFTSGDPIGYLDLVQQFGTITRAPGSIHVLRMVRGF